MVRVSTCRKQCTGPSNHYQPTARFVLIQELSFPTDAVSNLAGC